nr:thermonuclease family protein [Neorhizobium lilium]
MPILRDLLLATALLGVLLLIAARLDTGKETDMRGPFHVIDGDTLSAGGERLRLLGIDAPELHQICKDAEGRDWRCGSAARMGLIRLVEAGDVECRGRARDRYHRLLVECRRGADSINGRMVREGLAVASGGYEHEEAEAQQARQGLWAGEFERPRQWRDEHARTKEADPLEGFWDWLKEKLGRTAI